MSTFEDFAGRVAGCLQEHLPESGFVPYRYPSGENKSVHMASPSELLVMEGQGEQLHLSQRTYRITIEQVR